MTSSVHHDHGGTGSGLDAAEASLNFRAAIDFCAPIGISIVGLDGRILFVNSYFCKLVGWSQEELTGTLPPRPYWPPEERSAIEAAFGAIMTEEPPDDGVELTIMRKSGERFPVLLMINPYVDESGNRAGWVVSVLDITRRQQAEHYLKQNSERLRLMVEVSQYKAESVQELLDFALDKVLLLTDSAIGYIYHYHEERREFVLNTWSRDVLPACSVTNVPSVYHLDKTGIWGEAVRQRRPVIVNDFQAPHPLKKGYPEGHVPLKRFMSIPVFDGERIVAVVGVGNKQMPYDDTDVKQLGLMMHGVWRYTSKLEAETRLTNIRERFEFALMTGKQALWEWSPATGALEWSDSVDGILGYEPGEFPRTLEAWKSGLHPDDREQVLALLQRHLEDNSLFCIDYRMRRNDGGYVYWHDTAVTFRDEQGQPLRVVGSCVDITERKQNEINLRQMQAQLIQQEKMASVGQLAAGVAHEINNPLGFIASNLTTLGKYHQRIDEYLDVLETALLDYSGRDWPAALTECRTKLKIDHIRADLGELMQESLEGVERVKSIVTDLKSFSRSDDRLTTPVDLNRCVQTTLNIVRNEYKYVADLSLDLQDELPPVRGNSQQLGQVVANLVVNAAHAIDGHGRIIIKTWRDNCDVLLSVSDTGTGILPEHLEQIFDPFFTTKESGKGTGLGLSICYDIIKKHQGKITVDSSSGQGSAFTVRLPVAEAVPGVPVTEGGIDASL